MKYFSEIMNSAVISEHSTSFRLEDDWGQGRTVFGGMQGAMAVKAMRCAMGNDTPLRSLQAVFVGPVHFGEVTVTARTLRQGKSATQVHAELCTGDRVRLIATGIFGTERESEVNKLPTAPPCPRNLKDAVALPYTEGLMPTFLQHFETRVSQGIRPYSGAKDPRSITFTRHIDPAPLSEFHLVAMGDVAAPVALASLTKPAPASSMSWQLELVRQPRDLSGNQWFRVDSKAMASGHGYSWQNTNYYDEQGKLVMLSRQCMAIFG